MAELRIGKTLISDDSDCYVIAEIGNNHQGDMEKARDLFRAAKYAGVDAVKLQKRDNRVLYTKAAYDKPYENENSFGTTYGEHRNFLEFGWDEYVELKALAAELELDFMATAFDMPSAAFLGKLDIDGIKVASGDLRNIPLIKYLAGFGKPLIVSELGAGAKLGLHASPGEMRIFSEEYQVEEYERQLSMLSDQSTVRGMSPWVLKDFRAPLRLYQGVQDYWNRKGLVSEKGERKAAFDVLQAHYGAMAGQSEI